MVEPDIPVNFRYWASPEHEIDFVVDPLRLLEIKRGRAGLFDFGWFPRVFPKSHLTVVNESAFDGSFVRGIPMETFLKDGPA